MCKLSDEQIELAKDMYEDGNTYHEICRYIENLDGTVINPESLRYYITRKDKPKVTIKDKLAEQGIEKVLVLSDLHIPFHRDDIINIIEKHKDEITALVLGGDIIDCHSISSFPTLEPKPLVEEMAACHNILNQIHNIIPNVEKYIIVGNHELRYKRHLIKASSELNKLHSDNILKEIVKGFEHNDRANGKVTTYAALPYVVSDDWNCQYNDMIICHPLSYSKIAAKTSQMALDYFVERGIDFNVCLVAHTHKASSCWKYGKLAIEIGCCCQPQGYASSGKLTYTQQQCGYHLAVFKDGKYDVNESKNYIL